MAVAALFGVDTQLSRGDRPNVVAMDDRVEARSRGPDSAARVSKIAIDGIAVPDGPGWQVSPSLAGRSH
ncbi:hypothetical protein O7630_17180 [Micromonospora sp. WMMD718]|uniref:hypothetical protein n=1 Tax=unclassified Micromonospora TaxID=2617518 RepID=UPI00128C1C1D|nr:MULTISPECIES: hypothetical protein [unclassified Micromonospora]MDG4752678.1 hypothetical protein [Micromonospora sp. WMMD718]